MSKMRDLVTDVTFVLQGTKVVDAGLGRMETAYTYLCKETNALLTFHAHPTHPWNWIVLGGVESNETGRLVASFVIDAFCKAGAGATEEKFNEQIKELHIG